MVSVLWMEFRWEALLQSSHLLLPLANELVQMALTYQQGGLYADVILVVAQLRSAQVTPQDIQNQSLAAVQVFLELSSILVLTAQLLLFQLQRFLQINTQTLSGAK